jgi:6-phosphogluconolactonase
MIEAEWWDYDDADELADAVAGDVGFIIESALDARGQALIALPGGKTPGPIYEKLAKAKLDWKRVTIIPTDERIVAMTDPLSNAAMIAKIFLPKGARVIPVISEKAPDYQSAGKAADARLQDFPWPPDLVWLGVGVDGHTASIFPGPDLDEALNGPRVRRMIGVMPDPMPAEAPVARKSAQGWGLVISTDRSRAGRCRSGGRHPLVCIGEDSEGRQAGEPRNRAARPYI